MIKVWLPLLVALINTIAHADQIECTFDVNDSIHALQVLPNQNVYVSKKIDLPGGFRFAGQYLSELKKFKAYIYHTPQERYVLLTLQSFSITPDTCLQDFGQHRVYDSEDERELYFHCKKTCVQ